MKNTKPKLDLTQDDYQKIVQFILKRYEFEKMTLAATHDKYRAVVYEKMREAELLYTKIAKHPDYLTQNSALWLVSFLMETQSLYKNCFYVWSVIGDGDTSEFEQELSKAEQIHEQVNEFLIDCIED